MGGSPYRSVFIDPGDSNRLDILIAYDPGFDQKYESIRPIRILRPQNPILNMPRFWASPPIPPIPPRSTSR